MPDYNAGMAEIYYDQNGIVIVGCYQGGYQPEDVIEFDMPEAYSIYSAESDSWKWFEDEALQDPSMGVFFMNSQPSFALVSGINTLKIYDFTSNSVTMELHPELTYLSGVRFSRDDRYILAFDTTTEKSLVISLEDGSVIARLDSSPYLHDPDLYFHVDGEKIYIEQLGGSTGEGIIMDRHSQTILAYIPDMEYFDPEAGQIVCSRPDGTYIAYPNYSTEDLIGIAKQVLDGDS